MPLPLILVGVGESILVLLGLRLFWEKVLSRSARSGPVEPQLSPWPGSGSDLLLLLLLAIGGAMAFPLGLDYLLRQNGVNEISRAVWSAAAFQTGLLTGTLIFHFAVVPIEVGLTAQTKRTIRSGVITFLIVLPIVFCVALIWQNLLEWVGIPVGKQDVIKLFEQIHSPVLRTAFVLAALVVAPVTEEIIFRAGLFRFLRGRIPRWAAILISAVLFGGSHLLQAPAEGLAVFVPLVALGVIFCLAYERTGRIGTTMVAHALFNLNTLLALVCGLNP